MVRFRPFLCAIALLMLLPARTALAQIVPGWNTKQFSLERIDADRVRLMREVEIEGEPGSTNAGQKFFADDLRDEHQDRRADRPRQRGVPDADGAHRRRQRGVQHQDQARHVQQRVRASRSSASAASATSSMFGTLEPDVYFYGDRDRENRRRQVPHHQGRLHDVRAADAALGDRQRQRHASTSTTT